MLFGYARVFIAEQNPALPDPPTAAGVEEDNLHLDHASGAQASRSQLGLLQRLREGGLPLTEGKMPYAG